jgi:hypothetical protein
MNFINMNLLSCKKFFIFICSFYIINFIQIYYFVKSPTWIEIYPLFALNWIALWYSFSVFIIIKANYSTGRTLIMLIRIKSYVDLVFQCSKSIPVIFQYSSFQFQWNFHWKPEFPITGCRNLYNGQITYIYLSPIYWKECNKFI